MGNAAKLIGALTALGALGLSAYIALTPNALQEGIIDVFRALAGLIERIEP